MATNIPNNNYLLNLKISLIVYLFFPLFIIRLKYTLNCILKKIKIIGFYLNENVVNFIFIQINI